jgi:hypothetical protein
LDRARGDTISGKKGVAMNHFVTLGFVLLLAALVVALDGTLELRAIDWLAQSEGYTDIQNVMTVTNATIRFWGFYPKNSNPMSLLPMPGNRIQEIRECYQQATDCVQQAEAQNDPKVKKQFLELTRRWLLLARLLRQIW